MQIGVSSYSFHRYLSEEKMDLFQVIKEAASMGFDGIEFSGLPHKDAEKDPVAFAGRLRDACNDAGLPIVNYAIGADFINPGNGGDWTDEVERLKSEVKVCAALGSPRMRHDATRGYGDGRVHLADFLEALPTLVKGYRAVTEYASDQGVATMVENHGFCVQDSERVKLLIEQVDHKNFGALVDIGNFLCGDEDPFRAVTRVAPLAFHVHAKDFHIKSPDADPGDGWFRSRGGTWLRGSIIGHGNVDVPACLKAVSAAGYNGFVSIEFEGMEDNLKALQIGLANLRKYLAE